MSKIACGGVIGFQVLVDGVVVLYVSCDHHELLHHEEQGC